MRNPILCAVFAIGTMLAAPTAQASPATEAFIQQNFDKGYMILNDASLSEMERRDQFRALLLQLAATRRVALFTLGPYASAQPAVVDGFVQAFTNYSLSVYERGLNQYNGQKLKVSGSSDRAADDSIVQAEIVGPNGNSISVSFRVRRNETGLPTITDLLIAGISLATTQRDEFTAYLHQSNGNISQLSARLNGMAENRGAPN
jgi:phospholipid transport system substrate-binding protein